MSSPNGPLSRFHRPILGMVAVCAAAAGAIAAAPSYSVTELDLQTIPLTPRAINTAGDIVGSFIVRLPGQAPATRGFIRPHEGKATQAPLLANNPGEAVNCLALGINDQGIYVGSCEKTVGGPPQAFMQDQFGLADVGSRLGTVASRANAISNETSEDLFTIVGAMGSDLFTNGHAFAWIRPKSDPVGAVLDFGPGEAFGVNDNGLIVGELHNKNGTTSAFYFVDSNGNNAVDDGEVIELKTPKGSLNSAAYGVGPGSAIVGKCSGPGAKAIANPVIWETLLEQPDILGNANVAGAAFDINEFSQIVGVSGGNGFLFDQGVMYKLTDTVPSSAHYQVLEAFSINNTANIVANGHDTSTNKEIGSLLQPGEAPTTSIKSFTIFPNPAQPGDKMKVRLKLKGFVGARTVIPITFAKGGQPIELPVPVELVIPEGEREARAEFVLPDVPKGKYKVTANYGSRPKTITVQVKKKRDRN